MTDEKQDRDRAERDQDRSQEAHWQVAEAAAEDEEQRMSEAAVQQAGEQEWEDEGGASRNEA